LPESVEGMRFREAYFWIGIPIAILCIWVLFFCIPFSSRIEDKRRELIDVEARIAAIDSELSRAGNPAMAQRDKAFSRNLPHQIPHLKAFPDFIKRVALSVRNGGVTITRLNGRLDEDSKESQSSLAYPVTEIDFTGQFMDIGQTLERIQGIGAYRRIVKAQLAAQENTYPDLKGSVAIEFKAWRD
jgi:hypothetical protein